MVAWESVSENSRRFSLHADMNFKKASESMVISGYALGLDFSPVISFLLFEYLAVWYFFVLRGSVRFLHFQWQITIYHPFHVGPLLQSEEPLFLTWMKSASGSSECSCRSQTP